MAFPQPRELSFEEFLDWEIRQPTRHEFVDGEIVAMIGGTQVHAAIIGNVYAGARAKLRGSACRAFVSEVLVRTGHDNGRYPDVTIDCGPWQPDARVASEPTVVFEVLSETTRLRDRTRKLADYNATPSIQHYVLIEPDEPLVEVYSRASHGEFSVIPAVIEGLDAPVELPAVGLTLTMAEVYEGITFPVTDVPFPGSPAVRPGG